MPRLAGWLAGWLHVAAAAAAAVARPRYLTKRGALCGPGDVLFELINAVTVALGFRMFRSRRAIREHVRRRALPLPQPPTPDTDTEHAAKI
jgi:hypothetical protein